MANVNVNEKDPKPSRTWSVNQMVDFFFPINLFELNQNSMYIANFSNK